jgi:hypothetical protein
MNPLARKEGLIIRELPGELLVYDTTRHEAHCLNAPAAVVFKHSDGRTSVAALAKRLRREVDAKADETWVGLALELLNKAHLLDGDPRAPRESSRREALHRLGWAAAALPVVISVLAPTPAEAVASNCVPFGQSCVGNDNSPCELSPGDTCSTGACCCSGTCGAPNPPCC